MLTAAPPEVPPALFAQLADNGVLVAPVGQGDNQRLFRYTKTHGVIARQDLGPIRFVPMVHASATRLPSKTNPLGYDRPDAILVFWDLYATHSQCAI